MMANTRRHSSPNRLIDSFLFSGVQFFKIAFEVPFPIKSLQ